MEAALEEVDMVVSWMEEEQLVVCKLEQPVALEWLLEAYILEQVVELGAQSLVDMVSWLELVVEVPLEPEEVCILERVV